MHRFLYNTSLSSHARRRTHALRRVRLNRNLSSRPPPHTSASDADDGGSGFSGNEPPKSSTATVNATVAAGSTGSGSGGGSDHEDVGAKTGLFSADRVIAKPGEVSSRWKMVVPAFAAHMCIGSPYAWSALSGHLSREYGFVCSSAADWSLSEVTMPLSIVFALQARTRTNASLVLSAWERRGRVNMGVRAVVSSVSRHHEAANRLYACEDEHSAIYVRTDVACRPMFFARLLVSSCHRHITRASPRPRLALGSSRSAHARRWRCPPRASVVGWCSVPLGSTRTTYRCCTAATASSEAVESASATRPRCRWVLCVWPNDCQKTQNTRAY